MKKSLLLTLTLAGVALVSVVGIAGKIIVRKLLNESKIAQQQAAVEQAEANDPAAFINRFYHATYLLYFPTEEGGEKMACTATAFQKVVDFDSGKIEGYLFLTAAHCVDNKDTVDLTPDEGKGPRVYYHAEVLAQSDRSTGVDAAVLFTDIVEDIPLIPFGHDPTQIGETILNVSGPGGAPKQLFIGVVSSLNLNRPIKLPDGGNWEGDVMMQVSGEGPGSSGSALVCASQRAICAITVGHMASSSMVDCPVSRFQAWWKAVLAKKIPARPKPKDDDDAEERSHPVGKPVAPTPGIGKPLTFKY